MKILVTGAAGFIGFHLMQRLAAQGNEVVGIDNLNAYYDPNLKIRRLAACGICPPEGCPTARAVPATGGEGEVEYPDLPYGLPLRSRTAPHVVFIRLDITDAKGLGELFARERFDTAVNLAAQAGVRYSLENPEAYVESNVVGFLNLLECARRHPLKHFVYASSSSVYGGNTKTPFSEEDRVDNPVSLYAATKKCDELMAHVYAKLYAIPLTGLRFFTVYGPWGRPDMAPMLFARAILRGEPIRVFNRGELSRDFTYIDDIVEGVVRVIDRPPLAVEGGVPAEVYNIGCGRPMQLMEFIRTLEEALGKKAVMQLCPMQPGDVHTTYADTSKLEAAFGYKPRIDLKTGIERFVAWYETQR